MKTNSFFQKASVLFSLFLLLNIFPTEANAQIERVEPPFWWTEMETSEIEILFYGKDIAEYSVSTQEDIVINGVVKTENPNYLFVTIETKNLQPQTLHFNFSKKKRVKLTQEYELKERKENSALREGFSSADVMYLLMPDRFANGNPDNDSVKGLADKLNREAEGGRHGGDIQGIIDHLDYIKDLGATAIWSTPLLEDNDKAYSYHTYAQSDVYKIDPRYGSNEDYQRLAEEMHKRDMKLIMDYVTNHWGAEHWMIKDLPTYDWIHQFPGYANSNYRMETQYDPHASAIDAKYCEKGWFVSTMPDLNQSNPLVLQYLIQNAIWWIEFADLDGFRVDTYSYNDKEGISKWTKAIMDEYPNFNIVGEVWLHNQAQISYWQKDSEIGALQDFNSYCPSVMDFTLHDAIGNMFKEKAGWGSGMQKAYSNFVNDFLYPNTNNLLVFLENHDTGRFNEIYDQDFNSYQLGLTLIATTRGIPQLYYGSEIAMRGDKGKGDGDIRRDFPGGWEDDEQNAFQASERTELQENFYSFTKKLLNFRKNSKAIHKGELTHYLPENNVYVYFRELADDKVMVILNNNEEEQNLDLNRFQENLNGISTGKEVLSGKQLQLKEKLSIAGKTPMVIQL